MRDCVSFFIRKALAVSTWVGVCLRNSGSGRPGWLFRTKIRVWLLQQYLRVVVHLLLLVYPLETQQQYIIQKPAGRQASVQAETICLAEQCISLWRLPDDWTGLDGSGLPGPGLGSVASVASVTSVASVPPPARFG